MDPLNLTNLTYILGLEEVITQVNFLNDLIQAIGGIFIIYVVWMIISWRAARKERKLLEEINKGVKQLNNKLRKKKR